MKLTINLFMEGESEPRATKTVDAVNPVYFNPATRQNRPVFEDFVIKGGSWEAKLTFGYAPESDAEYEHLGLDPVPKFHPYYVSLRKQGIDILMHDRVILFHQLSEYGIVPTPHNQYNKIRGELRLVKGFSTAITKNSFILDENFRLLIEEIKDVLNGKKAGPGRKKHDYLSVKTTPDQIPEALMRDRLAGWLKTNKYMPKTNVHTEYVLTGIEGNIDILADNEAWELKVQQASALDVYQLFMYMDIGGFDKGALVADGFSTGAQIAAEKVAELHSKEITLIDREEFPINHPPTPDEQTNYY